MSRKPLVAAALGGVMLVALTAMAPQARALGDLLPVAEASTSQGRGTSSYLHDVSQPIPGVSVATSIVEHFRVTAPDGVPLDTWIVRPDIPGPVPVVLKLTPYYGGGDPTIGNVDGSVDPPAVSAEYLHLLERGYAVGISSVRGTGNSGGCFTIGGPAEAKDDATVIEFLAQQPWSNGNIGLMGASYDGTAPQDVWVEAPPHLKTIVPISGISDLYKYDFVNGVPIDDTVGFPAYYMEDWLQAVQQTGVPFKSWLGQWPHAMPTREDWLQVMTAWFDQFLKERDTGILDAPRVQVQDDSGVWRHEGKYPPAMSPVTLYPQVTGALGTSASGLGFAAYADYAGAPVSPDAGLPDDRVVFTSAPLTADLHLSGMPRFEGLVTATGDRANLMLTLGDQAPDGTITYINYATLSLNHAADLTAGKASVAGLAQQVGVNFFPQDNVVKAGHRLVLVGAGNLVQGANPDFKMRPIATGSRVTWDLAQTKLILPQDRSLVVEPVG